jgi:glycosyltransferase involved in cell wall biosynthesis
MLGDEELRGLYTMADCFVLPSRGEGVGLPYVEAMSSGIPCIATNWGGQVDFINDSNGYLLNSALVGATSENGLAPNFHDLFNSTMKWAEPDIQHLQKLMRHAYENREEVLARGRVAREDMLQMTWEKAGEALIFAIEEVISNEERYRV